MKQIIGGTAAIRIGAALLAAWIAVEPALAQPPADRIAGRWPAPFTTYVKECGYPIIFEDTLHVSMAHISRRLGPVITVDPALTQPAEAAHRRFMIAHECAHHRLGHTTRKGLRKRLSRKGIEDQELSADCWAVEALIRAGLDDDVRFMIDRFYRKGLHSPGGWYPAGVQRATIMFHCMKAEARRRLAADDHSAPAEDSR